MRPRATQRAKATRSLRVAFVILFVLVIFFFAIVLFLLFVVRLFSNEDIDGYGAIGTVWVEALWMYSAHAQSYAVLRWQPQRECAGREQAWDAEAWQRFCCQPLGWTRLELKIT